MDDWKEILVPRTATIGDAIGVLESSTFKTCLIVDEAENLKGTVTDGDIRRGMLRSFGLDDPLGDGYGIIRLTSEDEIGHVFGRFPDIEYDYVIRSDRNRQTLVKEWLITCRK